MSAPRRVLKILLFAVTFGFVGFVACVPSHRSAAPYNPPPGVCPQGSKLENGRCDCPGGTHEKNGRCVPAQWTPQGTPG